MQKQSKHFYPLIRDHRGRFRKATHTAPVFAPKVTLAVAQEWTFMDVLLAGLAGFALGCVAMVVLL